MNFLKDLLGKATSALSNLFKPQEMISPLPPNTYDSPSSSFQYGSPAVTGKKSALGGLDYNTPSYTPPDNFGDYGTSDSGGGNMTQEQMWDAEWASKHPGEGARPVGYHGEGGGGGSDLASQMLQAIVNPLGDALEKWRSKLEEFDKNNPFAFDEAQARASAEERLNPYYDAELNDFMTGIRRSSARSLEDQNRTVGELNTDASKLSERERLSTQEAIRGSEEGFAGAGLFFSGKRERQTGLETVGGLQKQEDIQTDLSRGVSSAQRSNLRTQEDLALQEARQKRLLEAGRTTSLETDISAQKKEAEYRRGLERLQFAGDIPGASAIDQLNLENQFYQNLR